MQATTTTNRSHLNSARCVSSCMKSPRNAAHYHYLLLGSSSAGRLSGLPPAEPHASCTPSDVASPLLLEAGLRGLRLRGLSCRSGIKASNISARRVQITYERWYHLTNAGPDCLCCCSLFTIEFVFITGVWINSRILKYRCNYLIQ